MMSLTSVRLVKLKMSQSSVESKKLEFQVPLIYLYFSFHASCTGTGDFLSGRTDANVVNRKQTFGLKWCRLVVGTQQFFLSLTYFLQYTYP